MALTAARTELNVSLVGEDETIRMLEDAKKRMGDLEAKTRSLTGATKAQTDAARSQTSVMDATNGKLKGLAERAEGVVGGVDKVKGAFEKVIGVAGFLGSAVTGAITAFNFLVDVFDDSEDEAAKLTAALDAQKRQMDATKDSADRLKKALDAMQGASAAAAAGARADSIKLAQLTGDMKQAASLAKEQELEQATEASNRTRAEIIKTRKEGELAGKDIERFNAQSKAEIQLLMKKEDELKKARKDRDIEAVTARDKEYKDLLKRNDETQKALRLARATVVQTESTTEELNKQLVIQDKLSEVLFDQYGATFDITQEVKNQNKEKEKPNKPTGGGGRAATGPSPEEIATEEKARREKLREIANDFRIEELDEERKHQRRLALAGVGEENLATLRETRDKVAAELASLPQGAMAAAFAPLKTELEKRLVELDALAKQHAQMGIAEYFDQEAADKVLSTWEAEQKAVEAVNAALSSLGETRLKAAEDAAKMREQLERENLAGYVTNFSDALQTLGQVQAPAFEVVSESLAGINAQMGKFKDGQQSLTTAIVGSAGAIAGAVGKKIDSVKVEAGIRALFETAMGFATLGNPAESAGHFTAALMFGLVAGGAIKATPRGGDGGGSKAPAKAAASTRDSTMGGGGGTITNVYNLQTGIVDGQSTAMAFRRAEMTARNTGMASAGGW